MYFHLKKNFKRSFTHWSFKIHLWRISYSVFLQQRKNAVSYAYFYHHSSAPDAPDVWVWINGDNTGLLVWKVLFFVCLFFIHQLGVSLWYYCTPDTFPHTNDCFSAYSYLLTPLLSSSLLQPMTHRQSHGQIKAYRATFWSPEENEQHSEIVSGSSFVAPVNLSNFAALRGDRIVASVIAENDDGASPSSSIVIPLNWTGTSWEVGRERWEFCHFYISLYNQVKKLLFCPLTAQK